MKSSVATSIDGNGVSWPISRATTWSMVVLASTSSASVRLGHTPVRNPAALTAWSPTWLPGWDRVRLVTTTTDCLKGSSGLRMGVNSKPAPSAAGIHCSMMAPLGT